MLPNGQFARFYELKTNKPLYFTKDYKLTYDDGDVPTHYSFKIGNRLDTIETQLADVKKNPPPPGGEVPSPQGATPERLFEHGRRAGSSRRLGRAFAEEIEDVASRGGAGSACVHGVTSGA